MLRLAKLQVCNRFVAGPLPRPISYVVYYKHKLCFQLDCTLSYIMAANDLLVLNDALINYDQEFFKINIMKYLHLICILYAYLGTHYV